MATTLSDHLIIHTPQGDDLEVFLNSNKEILIQNGEANPFWFTIPREDWEVIKKFIDAQFSKVNG